MANLADNRVYVKTYFRINTPVYGVNGFTDEAHRIRFYGEVTGILFALGFAVKTPERSWECPEGKRSIENLYCHPQELSGYVAEDSIDEIKQAIENANTFKLRWVDTYETVYNYSEDEFISALTDKRAEIESKILERFRTKRRNLYTFASALNGIRSGLQFFRRSVVGAAPLERIEGEYISAIFDQLVSNGKIVTAQKNGTTIYRTRTDKDPQIATA